MSVLTLVAGAFTTAIGLAGLIAPRKVCASIGLSLEGPRGEGAGISQFRATLGGFFVGVGVSAIVLDPPAGLAVGIGWLATAAGRAISLVVDRNATRPIVVELMLEALAGTLFVLGFVMA